MQAVFILAGLILFIMLVAGLLRSKLRSNKASGTSLTDNEIILLKKHVSFFNALDGKKQA